MPPSLLATALLLQSHDAAAELLGQLLLQDVRRTEGDISARDGVSKDRILSVHDPEMRHGHKSSGKRFDGHKAAVVVDTDSQVIIAVEILPGNAWDSAGALELVERSEAGALTDAKEEYGTSFETPFTMNIFNKTSADKFSCSKLVWCIYLDNDQSSVDLDSDHGSYSGFLLIRLSLPTSLYVLYFTVAPDEIALDSDVSSYYTTTI